MRGYWRLRPKHVLVNLALHTFHSGPTLTFASSQTFYSWLQFWEVILLGVDSVLIMRYLIWIWYHQCIAWAHGLSIPYSRLIVCLTVGKNCSSRLCHSYSSHQRIRDDFLDFLQSSCDSHWWQVWEIPLSRALLCLCMLHQDSDCYARNKIEECVRASGGNRGTPLSYREFACGLEWAYDWSLNGSSDWSAL